MGNRVPRVQTPVSESQLVQAIIESWKELFSATPTKEQVTMVLAQNALETGHRKSMWNYNVGNITTSGKGSFNYIDDLTTNEQIKPGKWEKRNLKYRAYPTLKDGVVDYLKFLSGKKYAGAWTHIMNPNPVAFSKALKQIGYYTADEAPYTKQLKSLFDRFSKSNVYEKANTNNVIPIKSIKPMNDPSANLISTVDKYLQQVAASERLNKKLYKKYLPVNHCCIQVRAADTDNAIEFSRILCSVLDQELLASASVHADKIVEVECAIHGPADDCFDAVKQLTAALVIDFKTATTKIGGIDVYATVISNKKSSNQLMDARNASIYYTKFLSKF